MAIFNSYVCLPGCFFFKGGTSQCPNEQSMGELFMNGTSLGLRMPCRAVPAATTSPGIYTGMSYEDDVSGRFHRIL